MTSVTLIILVVAVMVIAPLIALIGAAKKAGKPDFPYTKIPTLFSPAERSFLGVLEQAVPDEYRVFGKVRVADTLSVHKMKDPSRWTRAFNQISGKHFDYVLCRKDNLSIVCVIELDDRSHQQRKRQMRDEFLARACGAAALPLIQIPAQQAYSAQDLRTKIVCALAPGNAPSSTGAADHLGRLEPLLKNPG